MTLNEATKQLLEMHSDKTMPSYFKFDIARIINTLLMDAQEVSHGHWIRNDNGTYSCSECHSWISNEQHYYAKYCLYCGAKMDETLQWEEPEINPCRGCEDYDSQGGCLSKGGCGERKEDG